MTISIKNKLIWSVALFFAVVAGVLISYAQYANAQPSSLSVQTTATATTTVAYIGNGSATSTYQIDSGNIFSSSKTLNMQGIDSMYLYVQAAASSTATKYSIVPQFSNNNIDWYGFGTQGTADANGNIAVSTTTTFTWTPGTTATTSMTFVLPYSAALHERVVVSASGAAGALYMEVVLKKNPSTP